MANVVFQLIDCDYFTNANSPVVRIFGRTETGRSVCVLVNGFDPYFYVEGDTTKIVSAMTDDQRIKGLDIVERFSPLGYTDKKIKMVKVICFSPKSVRELREKYGSAEYVKKIYESDILFKYRFLVDAGLHGMDWVSVSGNRIFSKISKCDTYEAEFKDVKPAQDIGKNSPIKYMSVDSEWLIGDFTRQMDPKKDSLIIISIAFHPEYNGKKTIVLSTKHTTGAKGFEDEKTMLEEFLKIVHEYDPDIVTGYNINGFDIPFILERMKIYKVAPLFGRTADTSYSRSVGPNSADSIIHGRTVVDSFQLLKRDVYVRLQRYDLNTVARELLGDQKIDVDHKEIGKLWNTTDGQAKLVKYAEKDATLALDLLLKRGLLDKFFELSKVSGTLLQDSLGGQSMRIEMRVLHAFRDLGYVLPQKPNDFEVRRRMKQREKEGLKGAVVLEPEKGLHTDGCTLILDFKSLYPSLIITYNLSPDCLLTESSSKLPENKKHKSPLGDYFVDSGVHEGVLPLILKEIMKARSSARDAMRNAKTEEEKKILDAKQHALKILLNSFYGYTGYVKARLYMMEVAGAITGYGRDNLFTTKKLIEEKFNRKLIYADTDSAFVKTDIKDLNEARRLGEEISRYISEILPGVLELQFEKIYRTFLILTKKRYAGWAFTPEDGGWKDKIDMKGIETVRRDWCPLVSGTLNEILNTVLKEGDVQKAMDRVKDVINDLKTGKVDLNDLVVVKGISKSLGDYKGMQPHIELAKKINERKTGVVAGIGDRIGFVIVKGEEMMSKRAELPEYVKAHKLQIDDGYYIDRQLLPPVERILASVSIDRNELLGFGRQASIMDIMSGKRRNLKHEIVLKGLKQQETFDTWEGFVCSSCKKQYSRVPMNGACACGGELLFSHGGKTARMSKLGK
ncbi:MAG: DNA-directed DNA polymerase [Candidatus Aenigmatarchaeota archaeon]